MNVDVSAFSMRRSLLLVPITLAMLMPAPTATAQNGRLIEGLFRTLAEQQIEKERAKRAAEQNRPPALQPNQPAHVDHGKDPYEVRLPSGFENRGGHAHTPPTQPNRPNVNPPRAGGSNSISVRSREAADYAKQLVSFNNTIAPLVVELRREATQHPELRPLLPEAYQIAAEGRALLSRCDGLSSLSPIMQPYQDLDARWRKISFALRSINGLSNTTTSSIQQLDQYCSSMCKQLQIEPQFDRHALHDQMIVAATYMQAMLDDLELAPLSHHDSQRLTHDCRLLRQRLLTAADHVDDVTYAEMAESFTAFINDWGKFSQQVYALHNPHLDRRMARVGESGDQVYSILWMAPPKSMHDIAAIAHRLDTSVESISEKITLRSIASLPGESQLRLLNATRELYDHAVNLEQEASSQKPDSRKLQAIFAKLDQTWVSVQGDYAKVRSVNRGVLVDIDRNMQELRQALGGSSGGSVAISASQLIQAAAALEGTAEYINDRLRASSRNLQPSSFRNSVTTAAREFHLHARELHEEISKPGRLSDARYLSRLQREAEHMLEGYDQLTKDLDHIEDHGLSAAQAGHLKRAQRDIVPFVAQVAAALLEG
ncbi:MAG: hypothetical protein HKN47_28450 [Pirellulaceae bacterium]|nr:hypothetical protein [Pirellulaceae bacterium]